MTSGVSMHAMTRNVPPHPPQCSMSMRTQNALESARFLPDQDRRLISASDEARVFFQPIVGIDDAAGLVDTAPNSLKQRIAFVHRDVRTHEEGPGRPTMTVHKFLDDRFVGGFGREKIVRDRASGWWNAGAPGGRNSAVRCLCLRA